jgi:hypothetical protein
MIRSNLSSPSLNGAVFPLSNCFPTQPKIDRLNPATQEPKTYTTQEVVDLLGLTNSACLHKSKNEDKPYIHQSSTRSTTRIVLPLKRNTWMIFSPC